MHCHIPDYAIPWLILESIGEAALPTLSFPHCLSHTVLPTLSFPHCRFYGTSGSLTHRSRSSAPSPAGLKTSPRPLTADRPAAPSSRRPPPRSASRPSLPPGLCISTCRCEGGQQKGGPNRMVHGCELYKSQIIHTFYTHLYLALFPFGLSSAQIKHLTSRVPRRSSVSPWPPLPSLGTHLGSSPASGLGSNPKGLSLRRWFRSCRLPGLAPPSLHPHPLQWVGGTVMRTQTLRKARPQSGVTAITALAATPPPRPATSSAS